MSTTCSQIKELLPIIFLWYKGGSDNADDIKITAVT